MSAPGKGWGRMGFILHQKYGDRIFQIRLHRLDFPVSLVDSSYCGPEPAMANFLERIMTKRHNRPVGFDVIGSPFDRLRDSGSFDYYSERRLCMGDVASGFIYLTKWRDYSRCEWLANYVTREMFVANKPFYQALGKRADGDIRSAVDVNRFFSEMSRPHDETKTPPADPGGAP